MSFLLNDLEASATLQDALAFIDAFEEEGFGGDGSTGSESSSPPASTSSESPKRPKPKMRQAERVKREMHKLRRDAEQLEATLARLKAAAQCRGMNPGTVHEIEVFSASAATLMIREYQRRRQSEATNRKLKALLSRQLKFVRSSETALFSKLTDKDLDVLYESQKIILSPHKEIESSYTICSLTERIGRLKLTADNEMQRAGLADDSFLFGTQRRLDRTLGAVYQTVACTPLSCSVDTSDQLFWKAILEGLVCNQTPIVITGSSDEASVSIYHFGYEFMGMRTTAMMHKVVEPDRILYAWSSFTALPSQNMSFYEDRVFTIRRPESAADAVTPPLANPESVFRILYRIHAEENCSLEPLQEAVLKTQCNKVSKYFQTAETSLLDKIRCKGSVLSTFSSLRSMKALEEICEA